MLTEQTPEERMRKDLTLALIMLVRRFELKNLNDTDRKFLDGAKAMVNKYSNVTDNLR